MCQSVGNIRSAPSVSAGPITSRPVSVGGPVVGTAAVAGSASTAGIATEAATAPAAGTPTASPNSKSGAEGVGRVSARLLLCLRAVGSLLGVILAECILRHRICGIGSMDLVRDVQSCEGCSISSLVLRFLGRWERESHSLVAQGLATCTSHMI